MERAREDCDQFPGRRTVVHGGLTTPSGSDMALRIEDYAMIGDADASIDGGIAASARHARIRR